MGRKLKTVQSRKLSRQIATFLLNGWLIALTLSGCGEVTRPPALPIATPTAPPTPASYEGVPGAATVVPGGRSSNLPAVTVTPGAELPSLPISPTVAPELPGDPAETDAPSRAFSELDPVLLEKLYGVPGPGSKPGTGAGVTPLPAAKITRPANRIPPTPTLSTNPQAIRIEALKNTPVSFLAAYRQSSLKLLELNRTARLVFASANVLRNDRAVWSFLFVVPEGSRMWRVIYDSVGGQTSLQEMAPTMASDASLIDMTKVLDSAPLLDQAVKAGLNITLPVDIVNFQIEGLSKQPCFIFTNVAQGKQVAVHAYSGQIIRSDF